MIRVLVADDHAVVRRGLLQILEEAPDMVAAGQASTGLEVLRALRQDDYDVLVLDISMPEGGGLETLKQLRTLRPDLPVLILSVYPEKQYATRALTAGAAGYLTKEAASHELVAAIRQVARGAKYISSSLATALAEQLGDEERAPLDILSDRELQVLRLLASGKRIKDIAQDLSLSVKTVSTYRTRILTKLNLESTADLIRYALDRGLVG
ncbi:MAG: response regulator transcription factor [Anaerolineae bacterium]|jgi:DNA-binding NarL/FixJ family response regulator